MAEQVNSSVLAYPVSQLELASAFDARYETSASPHSPVLGRVDTYSCADSGHGHDDHGPGGNILDNCAMVERLDKLFHDEKEPYAKFLACRGPSAQRLLDLLQDFLDYDINLATMTRRRFFKALTRLSRNSKLHPRCFTLTGLEQGRLVAGGSFADVSKGSLRGHTVAVKMMRVFDESDVDSLLKAFGQEALIWRQLCHPNLLPFFGLYYYQTRLCLVSPWMENGHIRAFLKKESCDTDHLLSLILDIALGLEHLHDKDIVHGDLKGDNIFITPSRRACIADFGLSSIITPISSIQFTNSSKRTQGGTIRYQAPELHKGGHNDLCSDVYAFASVVYELLTGKPPFPELYMDAAVIQAVREGRRPLRPPSCSGTSLALDGLWSLIQNCWEERPTMRPTASQIVERLIGPDIQAKTTESTTDWDEQFTSRFRRHFMGERPPSVLEFDRMVFGDEGDEDENPEPRRPYMLIKRGRAEMRASGPAEPYEGAEDKKFEPLRPYILTNGGSGPTELYTVKGAEEKMTAGQAEEMFHHMQKLQHHQDTVAALQQHQHWPRSHEETMPWLYAANQLQMAQHHRAPPGFVSDDSGTSTSSGSAPSQKPAADDIYLVLETSTGPIRRPRRSITPIRRPLARRVTDRNSGEFIAKSPPESVRSGGGRYRP